MFLSVFLAYLFVIEASHWETCEDEIARERKEDWMQHGCRSCKFLPMDESNSPKTGYDCDLTLPTTSNVLRDNCECAHLRCADGNSTLAVNGTLVRRLRCFDAKWTTKTDGVAPSGVCARKCGLGICKAPSNDDGDSLHVPMDVYAPDDNHACAWGSCQNGAVGSTGATTVPYEGQVQFSCAGDGKWKGPDGEKHDNVQCFLGTPCAKLQLWNPENCSPMTTCVDPIIHTTTAFECSSDTDIAFPYGEKRIRFAIAITCDTNTGQWTYDITPSELGTIVSQAEFDAIIPREEQFFTCN